MQKGADDLTKEINSLLKDMKANGEYDKLYEKWIGQKQEK
ncbi:glutamine ABC transporter periplasmic protein [Streptococcus pneumoniae]|nr:glutamine ABC transporter periplasmic protein [Streptococcus pneumoniae]CRH97811.1 glutamine ABC transporter periplasmic protein [Streptococcus pneumoniae]